MVFLVSWVSASVHLGSGTKRAEGSALTISVAHCTLALSHHSPPHVSPVAARPAQGQLVPNHFVTLFVRDKYLLAAYEILQMFFESIPTQDFAFAIFVSAELILKQNVTSFSALILTIDRLYVKVLARLIITI